MNTELALRLCNELEGVFRQMDEELQGMATMTPRRARATWLAIALLAQPAAEVQ